MFVIFKKCGVTASSAKAVHDKQGFSRFCVQEKNFVEYQGRFYKMELKHKDNAIEPSLRHRHSPHRQAWLLHEQASAGGKPMYVETIDGAGDGPSVKLPSSAVPCGNEGLRNLCRQFSALFRKDFIIRKWKRHYIRSATELILPAFLIGVIVYLQSKVDTGHEGLVLMWSGPNTYSTLGPFSSEDIYFHRFTRAPTEETQIQQVLKVDCGRVAYAPRTTYTDSLMKIYLKANSSRVITPFETVEELDDYLLSINVSLDLAIIFDEDTAKGDNPGLLGYMFRFNSSRWHFNTGRKFNPDPPGGGPRSKHISFEERYLLFPSMNALFDKHLEFYNLRKHSGIEVSADWLPYNPKMKPFPTPRYLKDDTFLSVITFVPSMISFGCILFVLFFTLQIIQDKHSRIRELLRMMGMSDLVYWTNLFCIGCVSVGIIILMTLAVFCFFDSFDISVLPHSDRSLVLAVLVLFGIGTILQNLFISVLVNSPILGAIIALLAWVASIVTASSFLDPPGRNFYGSLSAEKKMYTSFLPTCGLYWAFKIISFWERAGIGAHWKNVRMIAQAGDNCSLLDIMGMMLLSWIIFAILIFYLDAVIPWQLGIPKHPLFVFQRSYWCPQSSSFDSSKTTSSTSKAQNSQAAMFESPPVNIGHPVIVLRDISHRFDASQKKAIDHLSLDLYRNQITVILGHNGAGKTTTMNILTGLFLPTAGEMYINGHSVRTDTAKARRGVGFCPQHNVLFNDLTVEEHLKFFALIKGANEKETTTEIEMLLMKFALLPQRHVQARHLSGGMKRKLCMANAMIGGSDILVLDEPTAGMDPQARRDVWTILQEARRSRTVLLTTHYMEEADVLGDRIAFLSSGKLKCAGSPMFLKKKFETGYNIRCAKASSETDVEKVVGTMKDFLRDNPVYLTSDLGLEFCVNVAFPETAHLVKLFRYIEENKDNLKIASFGVSVTTMEDVFLRVGELDQGHEDASNSHSATRFDRFPQFNRTFGWPLWLGQFRVLFLKRVHVIRRQWYMFVFLLVLPSVLAIMFCFLNNRLLAADLEDEVLNYTFNSLLTSRPKQSFIQETSPSINMITSILQDNALQIHRIPSNIDIDSYLLQQAGNDLSFYKECWSMGVSSDPKLSNETILWFNGEKLHIGGATLASWHTAVLNQRLANMPQRQKVSVNVRNQPLGQPFEEGNILLLVLVRFASFFPISLATACLTSSLIFFPIEECVSKAKLVQMMSGIHRIIYFGSSFFFDFLIMMLSAACMVVAFVTYDPGNSFTSYNDTWIATWVLLCGYGFTMIPIAYLSAHLFHAPGTGFVTMLGVVSISGGIIVLLIAMLDFIAMFPGNPFDFRIEDIELAIHLCNYIPPFAVVWAFINVHINAISKGFCEGLTNVTRATVCVELKHIASACCHPCDANGDVLTSGFCYKHESPFQLDLRNGAGYQLIAMLLVGLTALLVFILIETSSQRWWRTANVFKWNTILRSASNSIGRKQAGFRSFASVRTKEDADVVAERRKVELVVSEDRQGTYALVAHALTKYFERFKAVDNISFCVDPHECFGLLGVNGAGKTTTFGLLTGDLVTSEGNAYVVDADLINSLRRFQGYIGYCPQFDALLGNMSGREMLELFCVLRGVSYDQTESVVNQMVGLADLGTHANKPTNTYSGGTKRKLSIALAMIGNPAVLFLDEPTAGIDPVARRKIWATLMKAQRDLGTAVILTSHSMEECEALCSRLAIMVNGSFRCLGSPQHLKAKFGQGFTVLIKLKPSAVESIVVPQVCTLMDQLFPGENKLKDNYQCLLHFHITDTSLRWSVLFERMQELKEGFDFEDVVVSDTSLEQIFVAFTKTQRSNAPDDAGDALQFKTKVL
ncbi:ATP-binding cassette sub-family A member 2-like isoform X2 [Varroa destructor]|uniref:ABC transporter domain-containing protein n=1 Tax=Varroa destructor TaxID=109461 RepID=A0A7M7K547_VARDE|nr:ATP-binding cassette sub-family A member 2-like isoform X2 [Varroa destructor]